MNKPEVMSKIGKSSKGRPVGSKNKNTIYADQLRDIFVNRVSDEWDELVKAEIRDAKKNYRARHFIFEQVIGKSKESIEITEDKEQTSRISETVLKQIDKIYGKQGN
jgi:hypothetical protein